MEKKSKLEFAEKYTYNRETDQYVIPVKTRVKPLVLAGYKVRAIRKALTNAISPAQTASNVCLKFSLLESDLDEIKKALEITRDAFPLTKEEVIDNSVEESAALILENKQFAVSQMVEKREWKNTQEDANKWREFQSGVLDPFQAFIAEIKPYKTLKKAQSKIEQEGPKLLLGLSDVHFGSNSSASELFNAGGKGWNLDDTIKAVDKYSEEIEKLVKSRTDKFSECMVCSLGDQINGLENLTDKGTRLDGFPLRQEQWDAAFKTLLRFYQNLLEIFPSISIKSVGGNHSFSGDTTLSKAHEAYFASDKRVKFDIRTSRWCDFVYGGAGFIIEHGYSAYFKSKIPASGSPKEAYFQRLFWEKRELFAKCKRLYCLSGDIHTCSMEEFAAFEHFTFGSLVGFDRHADNCNLRGQPRQNGLVIENGRVSEMLNFYLD